MKCKSLMLDAVLQEQKTQAIVKKLIKEISNETSKAESLGGVKRIKDVPQCGVVSFSSLIANDAILCAGYYIQDYQAGIVMDGLSNCKTVTALQSNLHDMVKSGKTRHGERLNPVTMNILKEYILEG